LGKYSYLSFEYEFEKDEDEVYFSYCPPYTYSDLKAYLNSIKKDISKLKTEADDTSIYTEEKLCNSLSGI